MAKRFVRWLSKVVACGISRRRPWKAIVRQTAEMSWILILPLLCWYTLCLETVSSRIVLRNSVGTHPSFRIGVEIGPVLTAGDQSFHRAPEEAAGECTDCRLCLHRQPLAGSAFAGGHASRRTPPISIPHNSERYPGDVLWGAVKRLVRRSSVKRRSCFDGGVKTIQSLALWKDKRQ